MELDIKKEVQRNKEELIRLRRELHRIPEAGLDTYQTSRLIEKYLQQFPIKITTGLARTGITALLEGGQAGKTILCRADMDGLPIEEKNKTDYISLHNGYMHACGHDGHIAILLVLAKILSNEAIKKSLKGNVKLLFQPGEEQVGGARLMIEEGALKDPQVDAVIGYHIWNYLPVGTVGLREGALMANINSFRIKIIGKSVHGATPQKGIDSIVISSQFVCALQSMISREIDPLMPCVVSIGKISGGRAYNILADEVLLEGTVRTLDEDLNREIPKKIERLLRCMTESMRAGYEIEVLNASPALVNDRKITASIREAAKSVVGDESIVRADQTMGGEDFSFFLQEVPGTYFLLGSANPKKGYQAPHHSPTFDFDEDCMPIGVEILARALLRDLQ